MLRCHLQLTLSRNPPWSQRNYLSQVTMVKPPKTISDSEIAAICPLSRQPTIGKSRESHTGRGSGTTSPCLSFLTRRWGWRSLHSFCWPRTASWPQVWWLCPPASPPQAGKAALEGGTQAPITFNTLRPNSNSGTENHCSRRGGHLRWGDRTPHTVISSLRPDLLGGEVSIMQLCFSLFYSRKGLRNSPLHFPFLHPLQGRSWWAPEGSSGRDRRCPVQPQRPWDPNPPGAM